MKKLIMFVMVLMLCMGTSAKAADPIASYDFNGAFTDCSGNEYNGSVYEGDPCFSDDSPTSGSSGKSLSLDGASSVEIPIDGTLFAGSVPFSILCWFKTSADSGVIISSCPPGNLGDDHPLAVMIDEDGSVGFDYWWCCGGGTETKGLNNNAWHHLALVFDGDGTYTMYIDGNVDMAEPADFTPEPPDTDPVNNTVLIGDTISDEHIEFGESHWNGLLKDLAIYDVGLDIGGVREAMSSGFPCSGPKNPIDIDPNVMLVYEEGETEGDFEVSLKFPPMGQGSPGNPEITPISMEIIVDPNGFDGGGNADLTLIGGSGPDNRITFTRTPANWNVPEVIRFKAIDDSEEELPDLIEVQSISVWAVPTPHEPNLARPVAQKVPGGEVWDNDQADILFTYSLPEKTAPYANVTGPVQLWEELRVRYGTDYIRWINIGVTLQVKPMIDRDPCQPTSVKLNAVVEEVEDAPGDDNLPLTDPCLPYLESEDPNGMIFTADNYQTSQAIKVWGVDDDVLQVMGEEGYPSEDGGQNYQAQLSVWVVDTGGDDRYAKFVGQENAKTVTFDIEDDECGSYGRLALDIGNANAFTDPNYRDPEGNPLPDCVVDIYDVIEFTTQWLDCSNPQDLACTSYL